MRIIVDTSVWSLLLRRKSPREDPHVLELSRLARAGRIQMLGIIRQELLSGVTIKKQYNQLFHELSKYADLLTLPEDFIRAAEFFNHCQRKGVSATSFDTLICAQASRVDLPVFTRDKDFTLYAQHLPIQLYTHAPSA